VCGRICNHACETECTRGTLDQAVAIDEVKRFIADHDLHAETRYIPPMLNQTGKPYPEKIAIIGAGPAGMTCAYFLAEKGYSPVVFDKARRPGGMLMNGIPGFRLEKDVVEAEINILREMGVEFRCGVEVGKDVTIQQLREQGFKGFFVAIGLQSGGRLNVPGDDAQGVIPGIYFIKKVNIEGPQQLHGKVVVIGGGNIGADVARTAVRCGAESVDLYCLESYDEMPMGEEDRGECEKDGITIHAGWGQTEIVTENGQCRGIKFRKCLSVKNAEGRFAPTFDDAVTETAECATVLYCIGQRVDWGQLLAGTKVEFNPNGTAKADPVTLQTAEPDIFVGGDVYTGQKFAIHAIAAGKEGAISLHRWVHEGVTLTMGRDRRVYRALNKENILIDPQGVDGGARQMPGYNAARARTFGDTRVTFTEEQVKKETARCLSCGATKVDQYLCIGCGLCTTKCAFDAIHMVKMRDWEAGKFETMPIKVAEQVVKKAGKIIAKPFKK
ncbi:MAG: FAD-dependent oxidoreductase, partial [Oscillospiraceae bacterium]|nr:FAD-dependent oxidoreductase [Oscillospiraceae bacterium]